MKLSGALTLDVFGETAEAPLALCQPCCPHGLALPLCDSSILRSGRQREQAREREREQSQAQGSCVSNRVCVCVCVCTHVLCCFDMVSPDMCTLLCPAGQPIRTTHCWMWSKAPAMPSPDFWHLSLFLVHTIHVSGVCTWNPQTSFMIYFILIFNGLSFLLPNLSVHR